MSQLSDRFWNKVTPEGECSVWNGEITSKGYGIFNISSRHKILAHRMGWCLLFGYLGPTQILHHKCSNKHCVKPEHLELTTRELHMHRHRSSECKRGHPRNPEEERCKLCSREYHRLYARRRRATTRCD